MEIQLDLSRHCIETEIKKRYNQSVSAYFRPGADKAELEARIDLLNQALDAFDFPALRGCHPDLCGGSSQAVVLFDEPEGKPQLRVGDAVIGAGRKVSDRAQGGSR